MSRRTLFILAAAMLVVACVCVGAGAAFGVFGTQTPEEQPEQQASAAGRSSAPVVVPAGPVTDIGSGTCVSDSWYTLCFTGPKYPDDKTRHKDGLDEQLVTLIEKAQKTLDIADYDFDLSDVADAMAKAKARGVTVR